MSLSTDPARHPRRRPDLPPPRCSACSLPPAPGPGGVRAGRRRRQPPPTPAPAARTAGRWPADDREAGDRQPLRPGGAVGRRATCVAKGTLVILLIMSMGSWYVIFTKLWEQRQLMQQRPRPRPRPSGTPARSRPASARWRKAAPSATSPRAASRPASTTKARWSSRSTCTPGSRCRCSARSTTSTAACRTAWPSWPRSARRRRSSACSAPSGASTTR